MPRTHCFTLYQANCLGIANFFIEEIFKKEIYIEKV